MLGRTYERALTAPDAFTFCADSQFRAICLGQYDDHGGRPGVPRHAPQVVESWISGATRVLTVCGVDGHGKTYRTDFPVESSPTGSLLPTLEVFWDSKTYSTKAPGEPILASPRAQKFSC